MPHVCVRWLIKSTGGTAEARNLFEASGTKEMKLLRSTRRNEEFTQEAQLLPVPSLYTFFFFLTPPSLYTDDKKTWTPDKTQVFAGTEAPAVAFWIIAFMIFHFSQTKLKKIFRTRASFYIKTNRNYTGLKKYRNVF